MATKKDLIEAQGFSRRRLLTAFTSGAPGGKELEPAKPLRAVVAGVALAIMVIVGGVFYAQMRLGLPPGWENNKVILVKDTGARYVSVDGVLHPVINATSARLLLPADGYSLITTSSSALRGIPVGATIGILGAPDDVPKADALVPDGWTACPSADGTALSVPGEAALAAPNAAALVSSDGREYVVTGDTAYLVDGAARDAVLRAVGLAGLTPLEVESNWLNLFRAGAPLAPLVVEGAGAVIGGTTFVAGTAVHTQSPDNYYIVTAEGTLAPLSPLARSLYALGTGAGGSLVEVTAAEILSMHTDIEPAGGVDWPTDALVPVGIGAYVCAVLGHDLVGQPTTNLATTMTSPMGARPVLAPGAGALVVAGGEGNQNAHEVYLVDQTGTAFGLPDASDDVLASLGYAKADVSVVSTAWMQFFASGPELTRSAAASSPTGTDLVIAPTPDPASADPGAQPTPQASLQPSSQPAAGASAAPSAGATTTEGGASADAAGGGKCESGTVEYSTAAPQDFAFLQWDAVSKVATGKGVTIAVVDSGIDVSNAHLANAVIGGVNLVPDGERVDGMTDLYGHGTAVAGVISAEKIDESAMEGLAPDAHLLAVRVYRNSDDESIKAGLGPDALRMAEGIRWSVDNGANIVNVSMSEVDDVPELRDAVDYATTHGVLVVASAGNRNTSPDKADSPRYPAADAGTLAVAAVNLNGDVTDASIHGAHVDVAAPGQSVLTAMAGGGDCVFATDVESASYATAYASAAAALVAQAHPDESPAQWSYRLMATAIRTDADRRNDLAGWGVIQPLDAISFVPGSSERGPESPFATTAPPAIDPPVTVVHPHVVESPYVATKAVLAGAGVMAAAAMCTLGVLAVYRRRAQAEAALEAAVEAVVEAAPARTGLLDAARSDLTRLRG